MPGPVWPRRLTCIVTRSPVGTLSASLKTRCFRVLGSRLRAGVQSQGVFATVKHFVGNDAEFERGSIAQ